MATKKKEKFERLRDAPLREKGAIRFTDSDISEIRMMYRQAKNPQKQIGILSDMYICTKDEIKKVLDLPTIQQYCIKWTPQMDKQLLGFKSEGKTNREIAELMGRTEKSVEYRIYENGEMKLIKCVTSSIEAIDIAGELYCDTERTTILVRSEPDG